jgi:hypothetical protein
LPVLYAGDRPLSFAHNLRAQRHPGAGAAKNSGAIT